MWWKLFLLTVYLVALFILSRILEVIAYYEAGYLASRLLDPVSLSVRKLKTLLDQRGVSYAGVVEKQELTELVESSGEVTEAENEAASLTEESTATTNFTCGTHFYEEVEDTKDSVWVVQVIRDTSDAFLRHEDWKAFIKKVARFGVRTGIFDCSLDWRLCDRKNWHTSRLVMALPQGNKVKDNVILRSYTASTKVQAVFDWVNYNLATRIREIYDYEELHRDWFSWEEESTKPHSRKVRLVLFSKMKISPMFFSVLSVKFSGRAKFGMVNMNRKEGQRVYEHVRSKIKTIPMYLVLTPESNLTFGKQSGEYLSYNSMALLLRTLHPEVNDIFLLSLIIVNVACWFEFFMTCGNLFKRLGNMLWSIVKWNLLLILLWLPVLGICQLPYVDQLLGYILKVLRMFSMSSVASSVRADWLWYSSMHSGTLVFTFIAFATTVGIVYYYHKGGEDTTTANLTNNNSDWWNFNWDGYVNYLFRPMASLSRPMSGQDMDLEVGMELLIERLAVPNFWLRPMISPDYIKELPLWKYTGPNIESDVCSDAESGKFESDGEDCASASGCDSKPPSRAHSMESLRQLPYMFTCEKCRAMKDETNKTQEELDEERMHSESACAKYLMDGDYKCQCQKSHDACLDGRSTRHSSRSPAKQRARSQSPQTTTVNAIQQEASSTSVHDTNSDFVDSGDEQNDQMPKGMLPHTECVICLEGYRYGVLLCGLPCGHSFHHQCIMGWLSRDNHCCPVCRWPTYKAKPCSMHLHAE